MNIPPEFEEKIMKRLIFALIICVLACASVALAQQTRRPLTIDDLLQARRVGDPQLSPDGKWLAYSVAVPDKAANRSRTQIYLISADGGAAKQLTSGDASASEPRWSPDGKWVVYASNTEKVEATSTNSDLFLVPVNGGQPGTCLTCNNKGADASPQFSPDGRYIVYRSQTIPGYESDRWRLMLYDMQTRQARELTDKYDQWVESFTFSPDGKYIYFAAGERGRAPIYVVPAAGGQAARLLTGFNDDVQLARDGKTIIFSRSSAIRPTEIFRATLADPLRVASDGNAIAQVTHENDGFMAQYDLNAAEELTWTGAGDAKISGWLVKPPAFDPAKKYP